jgi:perosamine synthetase
MSRQVPMSASAAVPVELLPANTGVDMPAILLGWLAPSWRAASLVSGYEERFAGLLGGGSARAFSAGRVALAAALDALGIEAGDEIIVPGYTCVAVPNPILFAGAVPVYADVDSETLNLDPLSVIERITPKTKAIIVQHTFGYPAAVSELVQLARRYGLAVIEDCTHALGATIAGKPVGTFGDVAFFSSEQTKVISTGTGGMTYSPIPELAARIVQFANRCDPPKPANARKMMAYLAYTVVLRAPKRALRFDKADYYLQRLGLMSGPQNSPEEMRCERPESFALQLSGAQARVGLTQLGQLQHNLARRRRIASLYFQAFAGTHIQTFSSAPGSDPAFVRFPLRVRNKTAFATALAEKRIQAGLWFTAPIHPIEVSQERAGYRAGSCPTAERAVLEVANLPCHPRMTDEDARRVADAVLACEHA